MYDEAQRLHPLPSHAGTNRVVTNAMMISRILRYLSVAALLMPGLTPIAVAQDPNVFERILLPATVSNVPGAYGSLWSTELWYRNNGNVPVAMFPVAVSDFASSIGRTSFLPIGDRSPGTPGQILFISRAGADDVQFDLRLFNRADPHGSWGTSVPVVRETQFVEFVDLINVPTGAEFRSALRIYGLSDDLLARETVNVRICSYDEQLLASTEMVLTGWPLYAQELSLADAFPEIRQVERVRVRVESATVKIWALVSVVSNATQQVSLVTPD